jgi:hypothetical protein
MKILCKHCGREEHEHHEFEPKMPDGCVCDPGEWLYSVSEICDHFDPYDSKESEICIHCEHERGCHKVKS